MTRPPRTEESAATVSTTYRVEGMTCGHCVSAVIEELGALDGVSTVSVDLVPGGKSTVTVAGPRPLTDGQIAAALDEAGDYRLADTAA
ncbi:MAG: heavy-metal-associated domain-containing protein [Candidatus Dormibacteraeota bacterium]|nr:heavy-metal-associated domain-containing protein [Candidatus Dormibacteraeota bacterium]